MSEYCLRWNNHRPNLVTVFSELLTSEALVDVTLATDGHYIHAHKLVLSACSVYFKDLFGANPCKHPIVILKDIRIDDLKTVIDFIYRGEVNVAQDRLQDVLKTAESLRIKGLAENPRNYDEIPCQSTRFPSSGLGPQVARQRSSLTDSREQSLSLEGEEDGEPGTPPSSKRRKITSSHDSSESQHDEQENDNTNRVLNVKDEPVDDRENDKSHSGDTEQESNVNRVADAMLMLQGASQDSGEDSGNAAGTSADATLSSSHSQGSMCRWGAGEPPTLESLLAGPYTPPGPPTPASSPPPPPVVLPSQSLPSSLSLISYPMHPPGPPFHIPKGWPPQFRRMSPNMLMAIEAVRSGKMGFTQAGKTYGVNGRTLWVYYRKLGYEVHNTFRGKKKFFENPAPNMNFTANVNCPGSSKDEEFSQEDVPAIPVVTVVEDDDDEIIPTDNSDSLIDVPVSEGHLQSTSEEHFTSHQPPPPLPHPVHLPQPPPPSNQNEEVTADEASRTLQNLLDSINMKNIWTTSV
ncbi:protein tramtrack, alpha isoform-like isoform X2 [Macrobrachium nipponense]